MTSPSVVLFDVTAVGALRRNSDGSARSLTVYPHARQVVDELRRSGVRVWIAAAEVGEAHLARLLEADELSQTFDGAVGVEGGMTELVERALAAIGSPEDPGRCLYVGEDREKRGSARRAGLAVAPHPALARPLLAGARLRYVRVRVPDSHANADWRPALLGLAFVPLRVAGPGGTTVYAIATTEAVAELDDLGFAVDRLGAEGCPDDTEVYLLRDDRQTRTGFLVPQGASMAWFTRGEESQRVLASTRDGLYVALPPGRSVESYHFAEAYHGHTEKLVPDLALMGLTGAARRAGLLAAAPASEPVLDDDAHRALTAVAADQIAADLARYTGTAPVTADGPVIRSRHILSADNAVATRALAQDLEAIADGALIVRLHRFWHEGRPLDNVEAELPGQSDELVLVTAHLDSTAAFSDGYEPVRDPAPGADDDASGTVAALAVARALCALAARRPAKRTLRFVLFNAEEHGLVGSRAYARDQAALDAPIAAVYQMDMVGYNREPPRTFEVHAGFLPGAEIQERSLALAERIRGLVPSVSPGLPPPQIYASRSPEERDPAEGRSDHASFHLVGYAACATTEDFFAGPDGDSAAEPNPNYHMVSDTFVDTEYAADLARVVAAAAWLTANL